MLKKIVRILIVCSILQLNHSVILSDHSPDWAEYLVEQLSDFKDVKKSYQSSMSKLKDEFSNCRGDFCYGFSEKLIVRQSFNLFLFYSFYR